MTKVSHKPLLPKSIDMGNMMQDDPRKKPIATHLRVTTQTNNEVLSTSLLKQNSWIQSSDRGAVCVN